MGQPTPLKSKGSLDLVWVGWLCSFLSVAIMWKSTWYFLAYAALWLTSIILAAIVLFQRRILAGLCLLLVTTVAVPPVWWMLVIYRGATTLTHELTDADAAVRKRAEEEQEAKQRTWDRAHSQPDPAFGTWTVTLWDSQGKEVSRCEAAGFERYGPEEIRFIMPLEEEDHASNFRVYHIDDAGNRGEWHEQATASSGWFLIESRPPLKDLRKIDFTWGDGQAGAPAGRGVFALIPD